jgi:hypothetical protein
MAWLTWLKLRLREGLGGAKRKTKTRHPAKRGAAMNRTHDTPCVEFLTQWTEGHEREQKNGSFSLIERVILSAGAMLIFSVSFQIDQMPEGESD